MLIDEVEVKIIAGNGGHGIVSFGKIEKVIAAVLSEDNFLQRQKIRQIL